MGARVRFDCCAVLFSVFILYIVVVKMNSAAVQLADPHSMGGWFAPFTNREYCAWFYWLMVFSALSVVLNVFFALFKVISSGKLYAVSNSMFWSMLIMHSIGYFTNRLLYTMCLNSV